MASVSCPNAPRSLRSRVSAWTIVVSICLFPIGLLALLAGRNHPSAQAVDRLGSRSSPVVV